ncbi:hypothetical protein ACLUEY_10710 [Vreelandella aquamarina]
MLKPPITLSIVPSKWQFWCHFCLYISGLFLVVWQFAWRPEWMLMLVPALIFSWQSIRRYQTVFCPRTVTLWVEHTPDALQGRWLQSNGELSYPYALRCTYLGPNLIGLNVGGQKIWLWPDSAPDSAQRELRLLLASSQ